MMMSIEKRNLDRRPVSWPVHMRVDGVLLPRAVARDLSVGGLFIQVGDARRAPRPGEPVGLRVFVAGRGGYLDLRGHVRWAGYSRTHDCLGVGIELDIVAAPANAAHPWAA